MTPKLKVDAHELMVMTDSEMNDVLLATLSAVVNLANDAAELRDELAVAQRRATDAMIRDRALDEIAGAVTGLHDEAQRQCHADNDPQEDRDAASHRVLAYARVAAAITELREGF